MSFFHHVKKLFVPSRHNAYRPHLLRRGSLLFLLGIALLAEAGLVGVLIARQAHNSFLAAVVQSEVVALTNSQRQSSGVGTLRENAKLTAAAQAKAADMAAHGYFAHVGPDGKEPWLWIQESGYAYQYAGENLAVRFVDAGDVVNAWMASPSHRANIVKGVYQEIGVGTAEGMYKGEPATFVVQYFGRPIPVAAAAPAPKPAKQTSPAPVAQTPVAPAPATEVVLGAEAGAAVAAPQASFTDSLGRQLMRVLSDPRASSSWALGGVAALLMLALAFAFFHHIQLQAKDLLLPGTLVAAVALVLLGANVHLLSGATADAEAAAVVYSLHEQ